MLSHLWSLVKQHRGTPRTNTKGVYNDPQLYGILILVYNGFQGMPKSKFITVTQQWNLFLLKKNVAIWMLQNKN